MENPYPDNYLKTVASANGCPEMWIEDCVQEMKVGIWLAVGSVKPLLVARSRAVDFIRQNVRDNRSQDHLPPVSYEDVLIHPTSDPWDSVDNVVDYIDALEKLPKSQVDVLIGDRLVSAARKYQIRKIAKHLVQQDELD